MNLLRPIKYLICFSLVLTVSFSNSQNTSNKILIIAHNQQQEFAASIQRTLQRGFPFLKFEIAKDKIKDLSEIQLVFIFFTGKTLGLHKQNPDGIYFFNINNCLQYYKKKYDNTQNSVFIMPIVGVAPNEKLPTMGYNDMEELNYIILHGALDDKNKQKLVLDLQKRNKEFTQPKRLVYNNSSLQPVDPKNRPFLSYGQGTTVSPIVRKMFHDLDKVIGFQPWFDEEKIPFGVKWKDFFQNALEHSETTLLFYSKDDMYRQGNVNVERHYAFKNMFNGESLTANVIPVTIDLTPKQIEDITYIEDNNLTTVNITSSDPMSYTTALEIIKNSLRKRHYTDDDFQDLISIVHKADLPFDAKNVEYFANYFNKSGYKIYPSSSLFFLPGINKEVLAKKAITSAKVLLFIFSDYDVNAYKEVSYFNKLKRELLNTSGNSKIILPLFIRTKPNTDAWQLLTDQLMYLVSGKDIETLNQMRRNLIDLTGQNKIIEGADVTELVKNFYDIVVVKTNFPIKPMLLKNPKYKNPNHNLPINCSFIF